MREGRLALSYASEDRILLGTDDNKTITLHWVIKYYCTYMNIYHRKSGLVSIRAGLGHHILLESSWMIIPPPHTHKSLKIGQIIPEKMYNTIYLWYSRFRLWKNALIFKSTRKSQLLWRTYAKSPHERRLGIFSYFKRKLERRAYFRKIVNPPFKQFWYS